MAKIIKLKWGKLLSLFTILPDALLLIYRIKIEEKAGALPLILIFAETARFIPTPKTKQ